MEERVQARLQFTDTNREKFFAMTAHALGSMLAGRFPDAWCALELAVKELGAGSVDMGFRLSLNYRTGRFEIDDLMVEWSRKIGQKDKDFSLVVFDPAQPELPGLKGGN